MNSLYAYTMVKTLYDQSEDFIDSFFPFVLKKCNSNQFIDIPNIQKQLKNEIAIPLHVLKSIINRAKKHDYLIQYEQTNQYKLTEKGKRYNEELETERDVVRRINNLLEDIKSFFLENNVKLIDKQLNELLLAFLNENLELLICFINTSAELKRLQVSPKSKNYKLLISYITNIEKQKPNKYETFKEMVLGSIISAILYSTKPSDINDISTKKFRHCYAYLDTNFIFSLLDLHPPEISEPVKELFDLLKRYKIKLRIFSFTIDEICRVIQRYGNESHKYPMNIHVDSIYSFLKRKGWKGSDAKEFIINIDKILMDFNIKIDETHHENLVSYSPPDGDLRSKIERYKSSQSTFYQNHDLAAIEKIMVIRGKSIRQLENSRAFFLTSDGGLSKFNFLEMEHKQNGTICEVIYDRLLTNILWLKNPNTDLPLKSIIATHSRKLFVRSGTWERFYDVLTRVKKDEKSSDENISNLFYHNYIEGVLRNIDDEEIEIIDEVFILEEIEKAGARKEHDLMKAEKASQEQMDIKLKEAKEQFKTTLKKELDKKDKELEDRLQKMKDEFINQLGKERIEQIKQKDEGKIELVNTLKQKIRMASTKAAQRYAGICTTVIIAIVITMTYGIYLVGKYFNVNDFIIIFFSLLFGSGSLLGLWRKLYTHITNWFFSYIFDKKIKDIDLKELLSNNKI